MAIKAPTAPTPPTPPVSPKAQDNGEGGHNTDTNQGSESTGKEFGIHINVSSPGDKTEKGQKVKQDTNAAGDGQLQKEVITKERDQLPEPQAVLTGDMPADRMLQTETKQPGDDALHVNSHDSSFGGISIWPFVLVFVTAFIGFTLLNYMKKKESEPVTAKMIKQEEKPEIKQGDSLKENKAPSTGKNKDDDTHKHFEIRI